MKLVLTPPAVRDLEGIADYIHARNPMAARQVKEALQSAMQLIASHPYVGRAQTRGLRRFAVPRLPYLIFYRVKELADVVEVIRLRHGARTPFPPSGE